MVPVGAPKPCDDRLNSVAEMALDMVKVAQALSEKISERVEIRIGLHAGPTIAGVIGTHKLFYDV